MYPQDTVRDVSPDEIKQIRASLQLTQQALADLLGVDRVAVARWETGRRNISAPTERLLLRIRNERLGRKPGSDSSKTKPRGRKGRS